MLEMTGLQIVFVLSLITIVLIGIIDIIRKTTVLEIIDQSRQNPQFKFLSFSGLFLFAGIVMLIIYS